MGPNELAALVAREADSGVAAALESWEASGALVAESIVARVSSVPTDQDITAEDLKSIVWQAEIRLRPQSVHQAQKAEPGFTVPRQLARLPVTAIKGVGSYWASQLAEMQVSTVGQFAGLSPAAIIKFVDSHGFTVAEIVARARSCNQSLPAIPEEWKQLTVTDVIAKGPDALSQDELLAGGIWDACLRLAAALDRDVLDDLVLGKLAASEDD